MSEVEFRRPTRHSSIPIKHDALAHLVTPGDVVTEDTDYMRGHGKLEPGQ